MAKKPITNQDYYNIMTSIDKEIKKIEDRFGEGKEIPMEMEEIREIIALYDINLQTKDEMDSNTISKESRTHLKNSSGFYTVALSSSRDFPEFIDK